MTPERHRLELEMETAIDIATMAGWMLAKNEIVVLDSRKLVADISRWAGEFEDWFESARDAEDADYMESVDLFAENKLLEAYGRKK